MYIKTKDTGQITGFEALYSIEKGNIYLTDSRLNNAPLSLQEAFHRLRRHSSENREEGSSKFYTVYQYLRNRGFHVFDSTSTTTLLSSHRMNVQRNSLSTWSTLPMTWIRNVKKYLWSYCSWLYSSIKACGTHTTAPPLTRLHYHISADSVESGIRVVQEHSRFDGVRTQTPSFDVYKPCSKFKKKYRGEPDFQILVKSANESLSYDFICQCLPPSSKTELKVAIVSGSSVSFMSIY